MSNYRIMAMLAACASRSIPIVASSRWWLCCTAWAIRRPGLGVRHEDAVHIPHRAGWRTRPGPLDDQPHLRAVVGDGPPRDDSASFERVAPDAEVGEHGEPEALGDHELPHLRAVG